MCPNRGRGDRRRRRLVQPKLAEYLAQRLSSSKPRRGRRRARDEPGGASPHRTATRCSRSSTVSSPIRISTAGPVRPRQSFAPVSLMIRTPQVLVFTPHCREDVERIRRAGEIERAGFTHATAGAGTRAGCRSSYSRKSPGSTRPRFTTRAAAGADRRPRRHVPVMIIQMGGVTQQNRAGQADPARGELGEALAAPARRADDRGNVSRLRSAGAGSGCSPQRVLPRDCRRLKRRAREVARVTRSRERYSGQGSRCRQHAGRIRRVDKV